MPDDRSAARRELETWFRRNVTNTNSYVGTLMGLVDNVLKEEAPALAAAAPNGKD